MSSELLSGTQNTKDSSVAISYELQQNIHLELVHFKTTSHFTCWVCCSTQSKFHQYQGTDGTTCEQEQAALRTSQQHVPVCDSPTTNLDMMYTTGNLPNHMGFKLTEIQSLDTEAVMITHQRQLEHYVCS